MNAQSKPREKRCKAPGCENKFLQYSSFIVVCSIKCALAYSKQQMAKTRRRERREDRERIKTRRDHERDAQRAFNAWVRERDFFESCICCGRVPVAVSNHAWDAGHYRTAGAAPQLRFNEDNCHKQLVSCNRNKSGNAVEYRIRLVKKIGVDRVEALESDNTIAKRTIDELKLIRKEYQIKARVLKFKREHAASAA